MDDYQSAWDEILRGSTLAWWEWDISSNKVRFNDLKARMLGFDPEYFRTGGYQAFTDRVHSEDHPGTMDAMRRVLEGKTRLYQTDYRIKTASGDYVWFMDRGIIIESGKDGKPLKIRGIVIDLGKESRRGTDIDALLSVIYRSGSFAGGNYSFLTVCSVCGKVKSEETHWIDLSPELFHLIGEKVSHGICPACLKELYPEMAEEVLKALPGDDRSVGKR